MKVRIGRGVRKRPDVFGGICYVPSRDDFFAAAADVFPLIAGLSAAWQEVPQIEEPAFKRLALLGICETLEPPTLEEAYSGPSFLGVFPEIPTVSEPLVVNCFSTAHCPLKCVYCHADDLMASYRASEADDDLANVLSTASMIPSMVAVITGGDPLTRPERAKRLIRHLAKQKSLVLDTSGVGDIDCMLEILVQFDVHVRISLDAISEVNDRVRPINSRYVPRGLRSRDLAAETIGKCLAAGLNVTVQTVVSARNENPAELFDLRDWLLSRAVRNWVLHVAVKGGSARRLEHAAKSKRRGSILPSPAVYAALWKIVDGTMREKLPLDIRCTDTDTNPNSVLLIGSRGDLFTEGYAHDGKVVLYSAESARPDMLAALWPHIDRFGHARRYLNWNPWFFEGRSLEEICFEVPVPDGGVVDPDLAGKQIVETEAKFAVADLEGLREALSANGFRPSVPTLQRDDYYDFPDGRLANLDFVVRIRCEDGRSFISLKGPRSYTVLNEYSRIELEFETIDEVQARVEMEARRLTITWYFEKRRTTYSRLGSSAIVVIDDVPEVGSFAEVEGPLSETRSVMKLIEKCLGARGARNYREIFVAFKATEGLAKAEIKGASFAKQDLASDS